MFSYLGVNPSSAPDRDESRTGGRASKPVRDISRSSCVTMYLVSTGHVNVKIYTIYFLFIFTFT